MLGANLFHAPSKKKKKSSRRLEHVKNNGTDATLFYKAIGKKDLSPNWDPGYCRWGVGKCRSPTRSISGDIDCVTIFVPFNSQSYMTVRSHNHHFCFMYHNMWACGAYKCHLPGPTPLGVGLYSSLFPSNKQLNRLLLRYKAIIYFFVANIFFFNKYIFVNKEGETKITWSSRSRAVRIAIVCD